MICRIISFVPSRIWCTRRSLTILGSRALLIPLQRVVRQVSVASVQLQCIVRHIEARVGGVPLGHRRVRRLLWVLLIDHLRRRADHRP